MNKALKAYGISETAVPIGEGVEATAYALDENTVLKVYKAPADKVINGVQSLKRFYDTLHSEIVQFEVPSILSVDERDGVVYSKDKLLAGTELKKYLPVFNSLVREHAINAYFEGATQIKNLTPEYSYYGEILAHEPIRANSWNDYLAAKLDSALKKSTYTLQLDVPRLPTIIENMKTDFSIVSDVEKPMLVHGDYFVSNVLVNDTGDVTSVLDFNDLTLAGDPRMDAASAVLFFNHDAGDEDTNKLLELGIEEYGGNFPKIVDFYRMYYAIIFGSVCKENDPETYAWSLRSLRG